MKFIRWVIEVRPFRLLVDCMAAYRGNYISNRLTTYYSGYAHRFSSSILIRKPWPSLALVLLPGGLIASGGEGRGARGGTGTKATGPATSTLWVSFSRKGRTTL